MLTQKKGFERDYVKLINKHPILYEISKTLIAHLYSVVIIPA